MSEPQRVAILTIGSELLSGDGTDTNSGWLSRKLALLGVRCRLHASCPDDLDAIVGTLEHAAAQARIIIMTGGLGPTSDDLTRQAVARFAGVSLELHEPSLEHIRALFARFGRDMPDSNSVQAELPQGAEVLRNDVGTATCFAVTRGETQIYALPGVPREVYWMWDTYLAERFAAIGGARFERTFRTVGISESALGERLKPIEDDPAIEVRYAAEETKGTIRVTFLTEAEDAAQAAQDKAEELVGKHICTRGHVLLPQEVARVLLEKELSVATAESCTGGRVAAAITGNAGVSAVFSEGFVTYSNAAKTKHLGVSEEILEEHGAVSEEVARAMAIGVRERTGSAIGLGVTGIAGPGGGSDEKPVGLVHMAVAGPGDGEVRHLRRRYPGKRDLVQTRATAGALDLIRRAALGLD